MASGKVSAESLPPLRVDPGLLGRGTPPTKIVAPAVVAAPSPTATPAPAVVSTPVVSAAPVAMEKPVASLPPATAQPSPSLPSTPATPVAPAPVVAALPVTVSQSRDVKTVEKTAPPAVAEQPALPALYSAHAAAGKLRDGMPIGNATYVVADNIRGLNEVELIAEGNVDLRKQDKQLTADKVTYWETDAEVEAVGNVRLTQGQDLVAGPYLRMKTEQETGYFEKPSYRFNRAARQSRQQPGLFDETVYPGEKPLLAVAPGSVASGNAERLDFEGEDKFRFTDASYSTCQPATGENPDWYAQASSFELDYVEEEGVGRNTAVYFQGVPILYSPWLSFSLNSKRRSGLLAPSFGSSTLSGAQYAQPIYWNIAADKDATFTPRVMSKRGTLLAGEFRYLDPMYSGTISGQYLPDDKLTNTSRNSLSLNHMQNLGHGLSGSLIYNSVSDYRFLSDLSNSIGAVAQTNLLRQGSLNYSSTWWSASLLAQSYQTLQEPTVDPLKLNEPYRRLPQLTLTANRSDLPFGSMFDFNSEYVQFRHPTLPEASRLSIYPQVSLPLITAATYITPKLGYHATNYSLNRQPAGVPDKISRGVPIVSIDSGITFERNTSWFGKSFTQTLEPRAHYLYIPFRDQTNIPVFDTGFTDFNFATIFAENRYGGNDRIGDANQLTTMLASRLIDPESGAEAIRGAIGQRVYFTTQKVGLPATPTTPAEVLRTDRRTDVLGALSGRIAPNTYADLGVQYSPRFSRTERLTLSARYQPDAGRVLNAGYRYNRDQFGQIDISGQWPLWQRWNAVGRINYSTKEHQIIENLAGLEYDAGCWAIRGVVQQFATIGQTTNKALMFQLELKGLSTFGVGDNVTKQLKRNIPGYGIINPSSMSSSFAAE